MQHQTEERHPLQIDEEPSTADEPQLATRHIIADLRRKTRLQCEHIMQLQRAIQQQQQQHRHDISVRSDQLAVLANQLLLLESRLKRRQTQIAVVMRQREHTIVRQQKVIETLSNRLTDHGLGVSVLPDRTSAMPFDINTFANNTTGGHIVNTDLDSLNDSDSAVVLDDIDLDWTSTASGIGMRRDSNGGAQPHINGSGGSEGVTIVRSISDAIDTNYKATYGSGGKRGNCFLRRPEILETVYSVEEDHEPAITAAVDQSACVQSTATQNPTAAAKRLAMRAGSLTGRCTRAVADAAADTVSIASAPSLLAMASASLSPERIANGEGGGAGAASVVRTSHYNRVMSSNHRSVTKPKDVKYRRINKVKSKSLEELCGQLKQTDGSGGEGTDPAHGCGQQQQQQQHLHDHPNQQVQQQQQQPRGALTNMVMQKRSVGANNHT